MKLDGQTAIVAGGGQAAGETIGNGRAISIRLAEQGAHVVVVDKELQSAEQTCVMIAERTADDSRATPLSADVTREDDCRRVAASVVGERGRIDILHNNVGISQGDAMTAALPLEAWHRIMDVNLTSAFLMAKHVLPIMREAHRGVVLNTSSTASLCWPRTLAYKTSKAALNALTQHLALDNAPYGIRANAILPGLIDTPMAIERRVRETGVSRDDVRAERAARVPLTGITGSAWDIANAALFLASDDARYITGVLLPVDGGMSCKRG